MLFGFDMVAHPAGQFGRPSVASRMYLLLLSFTPDRYIAPVVTASRVGVFPPGVVASIAVEIGP